MRNMLLLVCMLISSTAISAAQLMVIEARLLKGDKIQYILDDQRLNFSQLGDALSKKMIDGLDDKKSVRIAILLDGRLALDNLSNLGGLVSKIGFDRPRYFISTSSNGTLSEVKADYSPPIFKSDLGQAMLADAP